MLSQCPASSHLFLPMAVWCHQVTYSQLDTLHMPEREQIFSSRSSAVTLSSLLPFLHSNYGASFPLKTVLPLTMSLFLYYYQSFWFVCNIENTHFSSSNSDLLVRYLINLTDYQDNIPFSGEYSSFLGDLASF